MFAAAKQHAVSLGMQNMQRPLPFLASVAWTIACPLFFTGIGLSQDEDLRVVEPLIVRDNAQTVQFSPNGELLLVGTYGDGVVLNLSKRSVLDEVPYTRSATFHPGGKLLTTRSSSTFGLRDVRLKRDLMRVPLPSSDERGADEVASRTAFSPNGRWLVTIGYLDEPDHPKALFVFDVQRREQVRRETLAKTRRIGLCTLPDNERVLVAAGSLRLTKIETGEVLWERVLPPDTFRVWTNAKGDGYYVFGRAGNGLVEVQSCSFDADAKPETLLSARQLTTVLCAPDDGMIVALNSAGQLLRYSAATQRVETIAAHEKEGRALAFSPDGRWLFTGGEDWRIRVWEAESLEPLCFVRPSRSAITQIEVSSNSKYLAGIVGGSAYVWNLPQVLALSKPK